MGCVFAVVGGPVLGPIIGGAVVQSYLRWRWIEYLTGIIIMTILLLDVIILDESYPARLLVYKARRLRLGLEIGHCTPDLRSGMCRYESLPKSLSYDHSRCF